VQPDGDEQYHTATINGPGVALTAVIERSAFDALCRALTARGYTLVGPTIRDSAIVYDRINSSADLPVGWTDEQRGGVYRLKPRGDRALFGYAVGPHSWKKYLLPPRLTLWRAQREADGFVVIEEPRDPPRLALIGVRSCELRAIASQDRVLTEDACVDPYYHAQRDRLFVLAVNCGQAGGTCFCVSMDAGPRASSGFDLALTEVIDGDRHYFVAEAGTPLGTEVLSDVPHATATLGETRAGDAVIARTAASMGRQLDTTNIKHLLYENLDHPRWDQVAERCLACGNCTMVCPTCFCTTVEEVTDLAGTKAEHVRTWDSCFTLDFSYVHGPGSLRATHKARYRQWMTHKLATWIDQFGTSGCVGCGRCITWCPVGIDITEETAAIRGQSA
jgi:ferredoxin